MPSSAGKEDRGSAAAAAPFDKGQAASAEVDMGTPEQARHALITKTAAWRAFRQPFMGTKAALRKHGAGEQEALFQLGNAALLWLWHEEETMRDAIQRAAVDAGRDGTNPSEDLEPNSNPTTEG